MTFAFPFADVWSHPIYMASRLLESSPSICIIHPLEPHLIYFVADSYIFDINVREKIVIECILDPLASANLFA
jgi:hypothetical protein